MAVPAQVITAIADDQVSVGSTIEDLMASREVTYDEIVKFSVTPFGAVKFLITLLYTGTYYWMAGLGIKLVRNKAISKAPRVVAIALAIIKTISVVKTPKILLVALKIIQEKTSGFFRGYASSFGLSAVKDPVDISKAPIIPLLGVALVRSRAIAIIRIFRYPNNPVIGLVSSAVDALNKVLQPLLSLFIAPIARTIEMSRVISPDVILTAVRAPKSVTKASILPLLGIVLSRVKDVSKASITSALSIVLLKSIGISKRPLSPDIGLGVSTAYRNPIVNRSLFPDIGIALGLTTNRPSMGPLLGILPTIDFVYTDV